MVIQNNQHYIPTPTRRVPAPLATRARLSAANSVNNRALSVRSVFVIPVEPAGDIVPFVVDSGRRGDALAFFLVVVDDSAGVVFDAGAPKRVLVPEDSVDPTLVPVLIPEALLPAPPLRKLPGVENEGGLGV